MKRPLFISIIVTTYNWPEALAKVISALAAQTCSKFEIIVADDGSDNNTYTLIEKIKTKYSLAIKHVWQCDEGFRAAKIRNKAAVIASGDYLIFLDGDCVPLPHFVERHMKMAEQGWLVAGNRILLNKKFTDLILKNETDFLNISFYKWWLLRKSQYCNRVLPLLFLPLFPRKSQPYKWEGAKTCNLGLWKKDYLNVNGFDESYQGWGYEDSDLIIRLFKSGIKRKDGRFAIPVVHLWHDEQDRANLPANIERFQARLSDNIIRAAVGLEERDV